MESTRNMSRFGSVIGSPAIFGRFDLDFESIGVLIRLTVAAVAHRQARHEQDSPSAMKSPVDAGDF
jgi:hypothetical protein